MSEEFFISLRRIDRLERLEFCYVDFDGCWDLKSWTSARALVLQCCANGEDIFKSDEEFTEPSLVESLDYRGKSVEADGILVALWSSSRTLSRVTFDWHSARDSSNIPLYLTVCMWESTPPHPPLTLALDALPQLFNPTMLEVPGADQSITTTVVAKVLNWIVPLRNLSLPVHHTFSVADGFANLNLPALESLSLHRHSFRRPDFLTTATYKLLVRLLTLSTLPSLTALVLWAGSTKPPSPSLRLPPTTPSLGSTPSSTFFSSSSARRLSANFDSRTRRTTRRRTSSAFS